MSINNKLPEETEIKNDDGTITRISYRYNNKNEIIKKTTNFKIVYENIKVPKKVIERRNRMLKFGNAVNSLDNHSYIDTNQYNILSPSEWNDDNEDNNLSNNSLKINIHKKEKLFKNSSNNISKNTNYNKYKNETSQLNKFDYYNLRVSNLSEYTKESDLIELFSYFGHVTKVVVIKDKFTRKSKGFAFVNFSDKKCAKNALDKLNGYAYDNLILRIEYSFRK